MVDPSEPSPMPEPRAPWRFIPGCKTTFNYTVHAGTAIRGTRGFSFIGGVVPAHSRPSQVVHLVQRRRPRNNRERAAFDRKGQPHTKAVPSEQELTWPKPLSTDRHSCRAPQPRLHPPTPECARLSISRPPDTDSMAVSGQRSAARPGHRTTSRRRASPGGPSGDSATEGDWSP